MINLKFSMGGTRVETNIEDKLCLLRDESGKGKTYLFKLISRYAETEGLPYALFVYKEAGRHGLYPALQKYGEDGLVMIDDGYVYNKELIDYIQKAKCHVICDIKTYSEFPAMYRKKYGRYVVDVGTSNITLRRIGSENII